MNVRYTADDQQKLTDVAMGRLAPTLLIEGGQVLNVFTGQLERKEIAIAGRRIAYVGKLEQSGLSIDSTTERFDATDFILVPGYIEPHAHPFQLYNPVSLAEKVLTLGTTTLISDNLFHFTQLEDRELFDFLEELDHSPVKHFWWARWDAQTPLPAEKEYLFSADRVKEMLSHPLVLQGGELTDWMPLLQGDARMLEWMMEAKQKGKRVEGHAPGASYRTLSRLAAAGVTGDHESISPEEVWQRLELGYMTTLRHSSIRPDLPVLIQGLLKKEYVPWHRLMLTTDGATPLYLEQGFTDYLIRTAIENGCDSVRAYQMVTINPAIYYGLEGDLGAIAPGRIADINLLSSLDRPTPAIVFAEGKKWAEGTRLTATFPQANWQTYQGLQGEFSLSLTAEDFVFPDELEESVPVINLMNPVITRLTQESRELEEDCLYAFLVDPRGKWITPGVIRGFGQGIDGIASSYTGSNDLVVIGRDPASMAEAANRVGHLGGGIVWMQEQTLHYQLPLPLAGKMSKIPLDQLIEDLKPLIEQLKAFKHPFHDPLYTFLFLSSTHLPQVRLTADGLMSIKDKKIILPSIHIR